MHIAIVSEDAGLLPAPGGVDIGDQNAHLAGLATELGRAGNVVAIWTRRESPDAPAAVGRGDGVTVGRLTAAPAATLPGTSWCRTCPGSPAACGAPGRRTRPT